jgi:hypothetical protein
MSKHRSKLIGQHRMFVPVGTGWPQLNQAKGRVEILEQVESGNRVEGIKALYRVRNVRNGFVGYAFADELEKEHSDA